MSAWPGFAAALAVWLVELWVLRSAWLGWSEWPVVVLLSLAAVVAGGGLAALWVAACSGLGRLRGFMISAPLWLPVGVYAGRAAVMRRFLDGAAPLAGVMGAAIFATVLHLTVSRSSVRRRWWLLPAIAALVAAVVLPARSADVMVVGWVALGFGLIVAAWPRGPSIKPTTLVLVTAIAGVIAVVGSAGISPNARFALLAQTRVIGRVLPSLKIFPSLQANAHAAIQIATPWASLHAAVGDVGTANLVLITVDAERADSPLQPTPITFATAYAPAPRTSLSLASLLTGAAVAAVVGGGPQTAAETLRSRRWFTAAWYPAGVFFDHRPELRRYADQHFGFAWADTRTLDAVELTDAVLARLDELEAKGEPRAFLWVHYFDAHEPYQAHPPAVAGDPPRRRYQSELDEVAGQVERLRRRLATLRRPSLVVLTADHGEEFGEHGGAYHGTSLYDEQLRVPLGIAVTGLVTPVTITAPMSLQDLMPHLLAVLDGDAAPSTNADVRAQVDDLRMLRRGDDKLIHDLRHDVDELYDLAADPAEHHNQASARPALVAELTQALLDGFGLRTPEMLAAVVADPKQPARLLAVREIGEREAVVAREPLAALLGDPQLAPEAAIALAALDDERARLTLLRLLHDPPYQARAAVALGRLKDARAVPVLTETLHDVHVDLRRHAAHYLGRLGGAAEARLLLQAASDDERIRNEAFEAVGLIASRLPSTVAEPLRAALAERLRTESHDDVRLRLQRALR